MAEITIGQHNEGRPLMLVGWRFWLWWVLASTVGWVVGGSVGSILAGSVAAAGVLQWLMVLERRAKRSGWWVFASTVGWLVSGLAGEIVCLAIIGAVYGAITGTVLIWLLRQPVSTVLISE